MATAAVTKTFTNGLAMQASPVNTNFSQLTNFLNTNVAHLDGTVSLSADMDAGANTLTNFVSTAAGDVASKAYHDSKSGGAVPYAEFTFTFQWYAIAFLAFYEGECSYVSGSVATVQDDIGLTIDETVDFKGWRQIRFEGFPEGVYAFTLEADRDAYVGAADGIIDDDGGVSNGIWGEFSRNSNRGSELTQMYWDVRSGNEYGHDCTAVSNFDDWGRFSGFWYEPPAGVSISSSGAWIPLLFAKGTAEGAPTTFSMRVKFWQIGTGEPFDV